MEDNKKLVVKHNKLVEFKGRMSLNELKLFSLIISDIRGQQERILEQYQIDISILKETTNHKDFYNYMKETAFKLESKRIEVESINEKGKRESYPIRLIYRPRIVEDSKFLEVFIDKELIPYIIDLKREFTRYQIENILKLRSSYAIRVYELLKQYESIAKREITVDDLREYLGVEDGEYKRFYDFEKWILKVAKEEINEFTDLYIDYTKNKKGRNVSSITFTINPKNFEEKIYIEYLNEAYNIAEMKEKMGLSDENLNSRQIIELYEIAVERTSGEDINPLDYIKLNYYNILNTKAPRNKFAYLKKSIEEDYAKAVAQLSIFNSFDEIAITHE